MDRGEGSTTSIPIHPLVRSAGCYSPTFVFVSVSFYSFFGPVVLYNYPLTLPSPLVEHLSLDHSFKGPFFVSFFFRLVPCNSYWTNRALTRETHSSCLVD